MDFLQTKLPRWRWSESLAGWDPDPDRTVRVAEVEEAVAGERCREIGIVANARIRLRISAPDHVVVELVGTADGLRRLEINYAQYVRVDADLDAELAPPTWSQPRPVSAPWTSDAPRPLHRPRSPLPAPAGLARRAAPASREAAPTS